MIFVPIMELCAGRQSMRKATRLASLVALSGTDMQLLPKSIRVSPVDAQYATIQKYFSHPSLVIYFFPTPPIKRKLGLYIGSETTNSKPIRNREQQSDHIYYTLLWLVLDLTVPFSSHNKLCKTLGQYHFVEPNRHVLAFLHPILICRITYWALWSCSTHAQYVIAQCSCSTCKTGLIIWALFWVVVRRDGASWRRGSWVEGYPCATNRKSLGLSSISNLRIAHLPLGKSQQKRRSGLCDCSAMWDACRAQCFVGSLQAEQHVVRLHAILDAVGVLALDSSCVQRSRLWWALQLAGASRSSLGVGIDHHHDQYDYTFMGRFLLVLAARRRSRRVCRSWWIRDPLRQLLRTNGDEAGRQCTERPQTEDQQTADI